MRKSNMFGIVIREEWKLNWKKFIVVLGIVLAASIVVIVRLGYLLSKGDFRTNTTVNDARVFVSLLDFKFLPICLIVEFIVALLCPALLVDKHVKELFKDDSSFLYKMLPVNGFELLCGKAVVAAIESVSLCVAVLLTSVVSVTQLLMVVEKMSGNVPNFGSSLKMLFDGLNTKDGAQMLAFATLLIAMVCFAASAVMLVAILRKSFRISMESKLVNFVCIVLVSALIFAILKMHYSAVIFAVLAAGIFVANCILYDKRVSV